MRTVALASGSNGNSVWVETRDARLLIDAGLSGRRLAERASRRGVDLDRADAILISHNHSDHTCGAGVLHRRLGVPLHATPGTWRVISPRVGRISRPSEFSPGDTLEFGGTRVRTLPTPHDGVEGVAFVVEENGVRLGVLTDLGHPFPLLEDTLPTLDAAYLESNYDPDMLRTGPYPAHLKERIAGPGGHLSNPECVDLARHAADGRLRSLVLCHLSGQNNSPEIALAAAGPLSDLEIDVRLAGRDGPSGWLEI